MPLELRFEANGKTRPFWYGRFKVNGKRECQNLGVKVEGAPHESGSLKEKGDEKFEASRRIAQAKLDALAEEVHSKRDAAWLVEKLYAIKTGEKVRTVLLKDLTKEWKLIPRRRKLDDRYSKQCVALLERFLEFVQKENPKADEIAHVTHQVARAFMGTQGERTISAKTWNDTLKLLRATFKYLLPAGAVNPFYNMVTRETETVFRKPFSPDELKAILDAAKEDNFIRPIIVTGMCTAMRRGDCCLLKWKDVDLKRKFVRVKTAKTGQTVSIPIFGLFEDELREAAKHRNGDEHVFPDQAAMYEDNPDGITWRVKKVLAIALGAMVPPKGAPKEVSDGEARRRGHAYIDGLSDSEKKERMRTAFDHYMDGKKTGEIVAATGVSKGSVSNYLNEIEANAKCRILRGRGHDVSFTARLKNDKELLSEERDGSDRKASVRDFHSLRVTWVTLALTAGVALELVQKVTGHKTTDIVLKHYFQPGSEDFKQALHEAMPKLLTNGQADAVEIVATVAPAAQNGEAAKHVREEMRSLLQQIKRKPLRERLLELLGQL